MCIMYVCISCIYSTLTALWIYLFKNCSIVLTQQTLKDYWDTVDYRDIFRVTIVIVKFSLSPSPTIYAIAI